MKIESKEHKLAVIIWNEYIAQAMNKTIDFSFENLEARISKETDLQKEHLTFLSEAIKKEQLSIDLDEKFINSLVNYNKKTSLIIEQARERIKKSEKNKEILSQIIIVIMFNKQ